MRGGGRGAVIHCDRGMGCGCGRADPAACWVIEDRLHWVRDMDYDEDRSQVRTASGPRVMATLRIL